MSVGANDVLIDLGPEIKINLSAGKFREIGFRSLIIAEPGAGKSYTSKIINRQLFEQGVQIVVFDVVGEYISMTEVSTKENEIWVIGGDSDIPASPDLVPLYMQMIEARKSLIFNLRDFEDEEEIRQFAEPFIRDLWNYAKKHSQPMLLTIEEAHQMAPQMVPKGTQIGLITLLKKIGLMGRKFGMNLLLVSQRPQEVSKAIISPTTFRMFGTISESTDFNAIKDYVKPFKFANMRGLNPDKKHHNFVITGIPGQEPYIAEVVGSLGFTDLGETPDIVYVPEITKSDKSKKEMSDFAARALAMIEEAKKHKEEESSKDETIKDQEREIKKLKEQLAIDDSVRRSMKKMGVDVTPSSKIKVEPLVPTEKITEMVTDLAVEKVKEYESKIEQLTKDVDEEQKARIETEREMNRYKKENDGLKIKAGKWDDLLMLLGSPTKIEVSGNPEKLPDFSAMIKEEVAKYASQFSGSATHIIVADAGEALRKKFQQDTVTKIMETVSKLPNIHIKMLGYVMGIGSRVRKKDLYWAIYHKNDQSEMSKKEREEFNAAYDELQAMKLFDITSHGITENITTFAREMTSSVNPTEEEIQAIVNAIKTQVYERVNHD